jgi:serine/threonine-protein kinase
MSPEQLRNEKLDFRSDIFSVGTVLYEIASGTNPYARENYAETISSILTHTAPSLGPNRIVKKESPRSSNAVS